jgi:hypothetical protein
MLKKLILLSSLLVTSLSAQATVISHSGYERDSASNIVRGGGLEWLKWDVTKGMSINSALTLYASEGWRLASNNEMASLFNVFKFGKNESWISSGGTDEHVSPWSSGESSPHNFFLDLFGKTYHESCTTVGVTVFCYENNDPRSYASAFFGNYDSRNINKKYNLAVILDDSAFVRTDANDVVSKRYSDGVAQLIENYCNANCTSSLDHYSVALVRSGVPSGVAVPTPGPIGLLALGLLALGFRRRQA